VSAEAAILSWPSLLALMNAQPGLAVHPWMGLLQGLILVGIVVVPVAGQAALSLWWLRRRMNQSRRNAPQSFAWILTRSLGFWLCFCLLKFGGVTAGGLLAKNSGNPLGYAGFALIALVILYAGFGRVIAFPLAAAMCHSQRTDG